MKDVFRLKRESKTILEQYSNDPNQAIFMLNSMVNMLKNKQKSIIPATELPPIGVLTERFSSDSCGMTIIANEKYWQTLTQTVDSCIEKAKRY